MVTALWLLSDLSSQSKTEKVKSNGKEVAKAIKLNQIENLGHIAKPDRNSFHFTVRIDS
jgi:hypothetical protein